MTDKWHVNLRTGKSGRCNAEIQLCPLSGDSGEENHFSTEKDAETALRGVMAMIHGAFATSSRNGAKKPKPTKSIPPVESFKIPEVVETFSNAQVKHWRGVNMPESYTPNAEIAKRVREDLKKAVASGVLPKNARFAVRSSNQSIDITVTGVGSERDLYDYEPTHKEFGKLKPKFQKILDNVNAIRNSYNYDSSDFSRDHSNMGFYGQTKFQTDADAAFEKCEKSRKRLNALISRSNKARLSDEKIALDPDYQTLKAEFDSALGEYRNKLSAENVAQDLILCGEKPDWEFVDGEAAWRGRQHSEAWLNRRDKDIREHGIKPVSAYF